MKKERILFVENNPADVELACQLLRKAGIQFTSQRVDNLKELHNALLYFSPDLVIIDYYLPEITGIEALARIREYDRHIPAIIFTGSINETVAVQCIKEGALDYVLKDHISRLPFSVKEAIQLKRSRKKTEQATRRSRQKQE